MIAISLGRKPLIGTVVSNVAAYGTGGINIDSARVPIGIDEQFAIPTEGSTANRGNIRFRGAVSAEHNAARMHQMIDQGRYPMNIIMPPGLKLPGDAERYFRRIGVEPNERGSPASN